LFLHRVLQRLLEIESIDHASEFASSFSHLEYFTHILELLLHDVLEKEADSAPADEGNALLPRVIKLLEAFPRDMLDVVVGCTRKMEVRLWRYLFKYAGRPKDLFEQCMERGMLKSAGGYLLVLHTLEHLKDSSQVDFLTWSR
jgi:RAB6A-GEF complex partner protein 1